MRKRSLPQKDWSGRRKDARVRRLIRAAFKRLLKPGWLILVTVIAAFVIWELPTHRLASIFSNFGEPGKTQSPADQTTDNANPQPESVPAVAVNKTDQPKLPPVEIVPAIDPSFKLSPCVSIQNEILESLPVLETARLRHNVGAGDTLSSIAERYGLSSDYPMEWDSDLKGFAAKDSKVTSKLKVGSEIAFVFNKGDLSRVELEIDSGVFLLLTPASPEDDKAEVGRKWKVEKKEMPRVSRQFVASGVVSQSFSQAATALGVDYSLIDDFVDIFDRRVQFHKDFRVGDHFTVIYEAEFLEDGTAVSSSRIVAARLNVNKQVMSAVRYIAPGAKPVYFDENGEPIGETFLRYPVKFSRISSVFTDDRLHPVTKVHKPHNGVDFAAPLGTPVRSVADGKAVFAGEKGPCGIMVKIHHNDRYSTAYLHLSRIADGVREGASIKRGQLIGAVGTTGSSTGPHLHYAFYDGGRYIDPLKVDLPMMNSLSAKENITKAYLARALETLERYEQQSG